MGSGSSNSGDEHREDSWLVARRDLTTLCAVCDGIGAAAPDVDAAALTISMLRAAFDSGGSPDAVLATVSDANRAIFGRSEAARRKEPGSDARWYGMGTTADVALFVPQRAHLAHVGDGSIYRFRQGRLEAQTTSHTLVNEHRRMRPDTTEADLARLPSNVIGRALGMRADLEIDRLEVETTSGDIWLLCSDGLTSLIPNDALQSILRAGGSADAINAAIMGAARAAERMKDVGDLTLVVYIVGG